MYKIEISEQADADLRDIFGYIAFDLQSMQNAIAQLDRLEERHHRFRSVDETISQVRK